MEWKRLLCEDRIRKYRAGKSPGDLRTEFEKDYHRIIGSASFRRLQDKTQVFPLDKSDFIRTRLTHSLEVSSLAKSLGQNISRKIMQEIGDKTFLDTYQADVCDILQCAGLLHDIGNPPFGHFGETVIREWFSKNLRKITYNGQSVESLLLPQMKADFYHFEGNTQALRLVTKLHYLVDEHGMNLTKGLLGTIIKYPVSSLEINSKSGNIKDKKWGIITPERDIFRDLQESLGVCGARHPLSYVLEAADDIAYLTADIEDAFKKGVLRSGSLYRNWINAAAGKRKTESISGWRKLWRKDLKSSSKGDCPAGESCGTELDCQGAGEADCLCNRRFCRALSGNYGWKIYGGVAERHGRGTAGLGIGGYCIPLCLYIQANLEIGNCCGNNLEFSSGKIHGCGNLL